MAKAKVLTLMGPTAIGKTDLAVKIAQHVPVEIISVDSAMIYQQMDIGTGKPDAETLKHAPHHLLDMIQPTEHYSAAAFARDANALIADIHQRGHIPLLVGGTMLYFKALKQGLASLPSADKALREKLMLEKQQQGLTKMHQRLQQIDPVAAKNIHQNDPQRLLRALEVYELTGQPLSWHWQQQSALADNYQLVEYALLPDDRHKLHEKIAQRFDGMLKMGLVEEVNYLLQQYQLTLDFPSMRCVGYRQILEFIAGQYSYEQAREKAIIATRQLAKRQLTWLRSWEGVKRFSDSDSLYQELCKIVEVNDE